jgi:hypothetical protein
MSVYDQDTDERVQKLESVGWVVYEVHYIRTAKLPPLETMESGNYLS